MIRDTKPGRMSAGKMTKLRAMGVKGTLKHARKAENAPRKYAAGGAAGYAGAGVVPGGSAKPSLSRPGRKMPSKGAAKGKGTNVNVIIMGKDGAGGPGAGPGGPGGPPPGAMPPPPMMPPRPPMAMAGGPPGMPPGGLPPGAMPSGGPPGASPPGMPPRVAAHGGAINQYATGGKVRVGRAWGGPPPAPKIGLRRTGALPMPDRSAAIEGANAAAPAIARPSMGMARPPMAGGMRMRASGGKVAKDDRDEEVKLPKGMKGESGASGKFAKGGRALKMRFGAASGEGRLEKERKYGKK